MGFKSLEIWHYSLDLSIEILKVSVKSELDILPPLRYQLQKSAISIVSNIAEGSERYGSKQTNYFYNIAIGSTAELIAQLYMARKMNCISETKFILLENQAEKIKATLKNISRNNLRYRKP